MTSADEEASAPSLNLLFRKRHSSDLSFSSSSSSASLSPPSSSSSHIYHDGSDSDTDTDTSTMAFSLAASRPCPSLGPDSAVLWWSAASRSRSSCCLAPDEYRLDAHDASRELSARHILHSVMHAVVLALQGLAALAVLTVFLWMMLCQDDSDAEPAFWEWLLEIPSLATCSVLVLCVVTIITHEVRVLSAVALLYLQAAILLMTSASVLVVWLAVAEQQASGPEDVLQSVLVGCCVFLWGMACLGFLRAVVIWRVTESDEAMVLARQRLFHDCVETYGTLRA